MLAASEVQVAEAVVGQVQGQEREVLLLVGLLVQRELGFLRLLLLLLLRLLLMVLLGAFYFLHLLNWLRLTIHYNFVTVRVCTYKGVEVLVSFISNKVFVLTIRVIERLQVFRCDRLDSNTTMCLSNSRWGDLFTAFILLFTVAAVVVVAHFLPA